MQADLDAFLSMWSATSVSLGWAAADLFGMAPPPAGRARRDMSGLIPLLEGKHVVAMYPDRAVIEGGARSAGHAPVRQTYHRRALERAFTAEPVTEDDLLERAAILEFDGGLSRAEAERMAFNPPRPETELVPSGRKGAEFCTRVRQGQTLSSVAASGQDRPFDIN